MNLDHDQFEQIDTSSIVIHRGINNNNNSISLNQGSNGFNQIPITTNQGSFEPNQGSEFNQGSFATNQGPNEVNQGPVFNQVPTTFGTRSLEDESASIAIPNQIQSFSEPNPIENRIIDSVESNLKQVDYFTPTIESNLRGESTRKYINELLGKSLTPDQITSVLMTNYLSNTVK